MADYGFRLVRDSGGKHSVPEALEHSWKLQELREVMDEKVKEEVAKLEKDGMRVSVVTDKERDIVEVRDKDTGLLMAWYEIEEFEQR